MNTTPLKNFAVQSRNILKQGVLNRILSLGFDMNGNITVSEPARIQGGSVFMDQLQDENFYDAWMELKGEISAKGVKNVCEEAAYTWFNRLIAIRIMQKNHFIEPVMEYVDEASRMPVIVAQARAGRLTLSLNAADRDKLNKLLADPTRIEDQFKLLIEAFCELNPVIYKCFGGIDKYVSLLLPDNILSKGGFVDLLNNTTYLTDEDYAQTELIGWLYQFYISEKKDEVFANFKKGQKADADDIPAATQIFTPNWIVKYMVQNTLGRIYLDNNPESSLGDEMKYLVKPEVPSPEKAMLKIEELSDYKLIDPACGSGHILIEGFDLLYAMYMDGLFREKEAIEKILRYNLIGIDLDTRAKQLATFALLMKAAQKNRSFLDARVMPRVLDMPRPFSGSEGDLRTVLTRFFAGGNETVINETVEAFELLRQADNLGSIMKFKVSDSTRHLIATRTAEWEGKDFLPEDTQNILPSMSLILALTDKYTVVVANPPYMGSKNMNPDLSKYVAANYADGKSDLFSVFMIVAEQMLTQNGKYGMINQQSWMFLSSFEELRGHILSSLHIDNMLHLGPRTFDELSGEIVQNTAFVITNRIPSYDACGNYYRLVDGKNCTGKERLFLRATSESKKIYYPNVPQNIFGKIPGSPVGYWASKTIIKAFDNSIFISNYSEPRVGMATANNDVFIRLWFEVSFCCSYFTAKNRTEAQQSRKKWFPFAKGGTRRLWYGNHEYLVDWYNDGEKIRNFKDEKTGRIRSHNYNLDYIFQSAITWGTIASGNTSFRLCPTGFLYSNSGYGMFFLKEHKDAMCYILAFLNSKVSNAVISLLSPGVGLESGYLRKIPCLIESTEKINNYVLQNINISKIDWDAHETSWDFQTNELLRIANQVGPIKAGWGDSVFH